MLSNCRCVLEIYEPSSEKMSLHWLPPIFQKFGISEKRKFFIILQIKITRTEILQKSAAGAFSWPMAHILRGSPNAVCLSVCHVPIACLSSMHVVHEDVVNIHVNERRLYTTGVSLQT